MRVVLVLLICSCAGISQSFEVATVRVASTDPAAGGKVARVATIDPIRFLRRGATLQSLLLEAYNLKPQQLTGPAWLASERYDINARVLEGATAEERSAMLRNLLTERFEIKLRRETKPINVYEMVVAKGGPKLREFAPGQGEMPAFRHGAIAVKGKGAVINASLREHGTMDGLATRLSGQLDRPIMDATGLKGDYEIVLHWNPGAETPKTDTAADPGVSLFAALESQLGLRLEPKRRALETIVIESARKVPVEN